MPCHSLVKFQVRGLGRFQPAHRCRVQDELAPFALENLGCIGNESRLTDCPAFDPTQDVSAEGQLDYDDIDYGTQTSICDPYQGTFARVACGTSEAASTPFTCDAYSARVESVLCMTRLDCVVKNVPSTDGSR